MWQSKRKNKEYKPNFAIFVDRAKALQYNSNKRKIW
jgi:hypothetical protein